MSGLKGGFDCIVGIDVSKDKFDACGITGEETKLFQISAAMDRKGFEKLKRHLGTVSVSSVLIGMESTASYHVNLFSYLVSEGYKVILINPLLISNYVKMQLRKTKTDKKDAVVIAQFLLANGDTLIQRATPAPSAGEFSGRDDIFENRDQAAPEYHLSGTGARGWYIYEVYSQAFAAISFRKCS